MEHERYTLSKTLETFEIERVQGKEFVNIKNPNKTYLVMFIANVESTRDDFPLTAVYRDTETGDIWCRDLAEFLKKNRVIKNL